MSWPPASHTNIFFDSDAKTDQQTYGRKIIHNFATRAYRRPLTSEEEATLTGVFQKSLAAGRSFQDSVKDALLVVLTSPQFLFLTEVSKSPAAGAAGWVRTGVEALLLVVERAARSQDACNWPAGGTLHEGDWTPRCCA